MVGGSAHPGVKTIGEVDMAGAVKTVVGEVDAPVGHEADFC